MRSRAPKRKVMPTVAQTVSDLPGLAPIISTVPIPDPTALTTDQLRRELAGLQELIETRLHAMDRASELLHANFTRIPTDTDRQVNHVRELHNERFVSIQKQFEERDIRARASEDAAKVAVNAALQAQKEMAAAQNESNAAAITKSEAATTKNIDGILALVNSISTAANDKIGVINGRLDRGEGVARGGEGMRTEARLNVGAVTGVVSAGVVVATAFAGLIAFALRH